MKDEIKEILDKLQKVANRETASRNALMEMKDKDYQLLLDYITNLQEYYNNNVNKYEELLVKYSNLQEEVNKLTVESTEWEERTYCWQDRAENLEIIIDKAIEMFDDEILNKYYYGMSYEFAIDDFKEDIFKILKGEDNE